MTILNWFFFVITILIASIVSISFWSRKKVKIKVLTLFFGAISFIFLYGTLLEILSRPKPKGLELLNRYANELTLLHVNWVEGEAIYLLVQLDNSVEPRLYKFPWNAAQAQEFDEVLSEGRENGQEVKIANPFYSSNTEERDTITYVAPVKPLPPKTAPEVGITSYDPEAEQKSYELKDSR
tara:strand:- start:7 stop:549 length:543 start_codon:yes stop_codon:yes gene_type:complete